MQLADARVSERPLFSERDRWFESAFLQQRVGCEPHSSIVIGAVAAILAADVAGYSRLIEVDEERTLTRSGIINEDSGRGLFTTQRKIGSGCSIRLRQTTDG
jgi:hypothetical protein